MHQQRREALIVFAKMPEPGRVKTRLATALTGAEAARLYEAFLRDALEQYAALERPVRLYLAPPAEAFPEAWLPAGVTLHPQRGDGLGPRMLNAFVETFAAGGERVVIVGTDHPTLPTAFVEAAFDLLQEPPAVAIGPSDDGGYYLLGMNELYPQLFEGMTYSHPDVFAETLARLKETDAHLSVLPAWYDVDTPDDLARLVRDLAERAGGSHRTRAVLEALRAAHPEQSWLRASPD